ncbi:MAG: hypothetical protein FP814_09630 [Desulfobacterium sp.]|nr:hypothetical protein [Desulfobacterium sp.]
MKQIYKILISVFVISILALASTQATAKRTYIPPPYSAIYSDNPGLSFIKLPTDCESNPGTCPNIVSYTFYLPTPAYTYIDVSGQLSNIYNAAAVTLKIDNVDSMTRSRFFNNAAGLNTVFNTGVQISTTNLLSPGNHTIYLSGYQINGSINPGTTAIGQISITVIANQNGNIVNR